MNNFIKIIVVLIALLALFVVGQKQDKTNTNYYINK